MDRDDELEGEEEDEVGYLYLGSVDVSSDREEYTTSDSDLEAEDAQVGEFEAEDIVSGDEAEDESVSAVGYEAEDEYTLPAPQKGRYFSIWQKMEMLGIFTNKLVFVVTLGSQKYFLGIESVFWAHWVH